MDRAEFDKFADEYLAIHQTNIRASGEAPDFFAEYKIKDIAHHVDGQIETSKILDFGGGIGTSVPHVRRYFPQGRLTCLDVSNRSLEIARERHGNAAEFVAFDGTTIPFDDDSYDVAYAACVFHHIDDPQHPRLLGELKRILRPGGFLFVFEHNPLNPLTRQAVNTCPFDENAVLIPGWRMKDRFKQAGFRSVGLRYRIFFPHLLSRLRGLEPYMTWLPLGAQYYVSGRKPGTV